MVRLNATLRSYRDSILRSSHFAVCDRRASCCPFHRHTAVRDLLLDAGADVNTSDTDQEIAILRMLNAPGANAGSTWLEYRIRILLELGADSNLGNAQGETALMRARQHNMTHIERLLIRFGAQAE